MKPVNLMPGEEYPLFPDCTLEQLYTSFAQTHKASTYDLPNLSMQKIIGLAMLDVPVFHVGMLYEILGCTEPYNNVTKNISLLLGKKYIKAVRIDSDSEFRTVYYLTKAGYSALSSQMGNCRDFQSKTGKRLLETAVHDYGAGCGYISLIRSPFSAYPTYEVSTMFEKAAMPAGKFMRRSLRPDAVIDYESSLTWGKIYLEHDTNSEASARMTDKLNLYYGHGILSATLNGRHLPTDRYEQNLILYTFRKAYGKRPACFSASSIKKLIASMDDNQCVTEFESNDSEITGVLKELKRLTPAFKERWKKTDLQLFQKNVTNKTDKSLIKYLKSYQRGGSASRRNGALRTLIREYNEGANSTYAPALREMLEGYPVCFCAFNNMERLLPVLFMEDHPQVLAYLKKVLFPYYGDITYTDRRRLFPSNKPGEKALCMSNIFEASTEELISVEYFSGDLSALMRMYSIFRFNYDLANMPFKCILLVDSFRDAATLLDIMAPDFKQGASSLHHGSLYDISFLTIGGTYLYSISRDDKEVRIEP